MTTRRKSVVDLTGSAKRTRLQEWPPATPAVSGGIGRPLEKETAQLGARPGRTLIMANEATREQLQAVRSRLAEQDEVLAETLLVLESNPRATVVIDPRVLAELDEQRDETAGAPIAALTGVFVRC